MGVSLKYNVNNSQLYQWCKIATSQGYESLFITRPRGRQAKNDMGRPRKRILKMTELELNPF